MILRPKTQAFDISFGAIHFSLQQVSKFKSQEGIELHFLNYGFQKCKKLKGIPNPRQRAIIAFTITRKQEMCLMYRKMNVLGTIVSDENCKK